MQIKTKQKSSLILRTKLKTKQILKHQSVDQRKTLAGVTNKTKPNKPKVTQNQPRKDNGKNEQSKKQQQKTKFERKQKGGELEGGNAGKFFFEQNT